MKQKYDLEQRLIDFAVVAIELTGKLSSEYSNKHLTSQLIRSTTSTALNYGEAQSAESGKDFIHKCKIILKELRESSVCLRIIGRTNHLSDCKPLLNETNQLICIFVKSIQTARRNISNS